jgi:simple sugar transport system ATP-binding protein
VLAPPEVERLFENLRVLREQGRTIVIVTHKLNEVFSLAEDVTVLRRGETVFAAPLSGLTPTLLAEKMIGRNADSLMMRSSESNTSSEVVLELGQLKLRSAEEEVGLESLDIKAGEIVGIAGVEGNGQQELADWIVGVRREKKQGVVIKLRGVDISDFSLEERHQAGVAYIPSDRHDEGMIEAYSLSENLHLRAPIVRGPMWLKGLRLLNHSAMRRHSSELLESYGVRPPEPDLKASALSGGNQQKVVVARELSAAPRLILACNPTRGLDVGAAADVYARLLSAAREQNAAVLLISSDLDEVLNLSDRVAVLYRGKLSTIWARGVTQEEVGRAMVGA